MQTECLHVEIEDDIESEVHEVFLLFLWRRFKKCTEVELKFFKNTFVDETVAVNKVLEQGVFLKRYEMLFSYGD